ncbi:MAG: efflux RND transporter periplasmic adaptor subunit [Planctomycetes bacterium]|nr:efflux RND transporter periplasmic adaptor subunit [Planctomycetota bacterium]
MLPPRLHALVVCALAVLAGCGGDTKPDAKGGGKPKSFAVEVQAVAERDLAYTVRAVGSLEAFERVPVSARVAGVIERMAVVEGDHVAAGAIIAEIDPARYRLELAALVADHARAKAARDEAASSVARREALAAQGEGLVSAEELAGVRARVQVAEAEVAQADARLRLAELDLEHATVRAPVAGVVQGRVATTGQYAQPGAVIVDLLRVDPLLVRFQVPADEAVTLKPDQPLSFITPGVSGANNAVISHVAAAADPRTRMVELIARVAPAEAERLRPGQFAQVVIPVGGTRAAVVPQTAIRPSEDGFLAFVVVDGVAKRRVLTIGLRTDDGLVEVRSGLTVGERVVVRGAEALVEGAAVREGGAKPAGAPDGGSSKLEARGSKPEAGDQPPPPSAAPPAAAP